MASTHGAWRHAGVRFLLSGVLLTCRHRVYSNACWYMTCLICEQYFRYVHRPHRLVVRTSRCGRDNPGSTPGEVSFEHFYGCVCIPYRDVQLLHTVEIRTVLHGCERVCEMCCCCPCGVLRVSVCSASRGRLRYECESDKRGSHVLFRMSRVPRSDWAHCGLVRAWCAQGACSLVHNTRKPKMDTLGIEPRASRMLSGCDTTTPCAPEAHVGFDTSLT